MARYRKVDPRIHNDRKFCSLSLEARYLFLFVLTHPQMTALGAFRTTKESLVSELKGLGEGFDEGFEEVLQKGLLKYDGESCLLYAKNFVKYNPPENPNVVKGWLSALDLLPECPLLIEVLVNASSVAHALFDGSKKGTINPLESVIETLSKEFGQPLPKSLANQEQEQKQEQEQEYTHNKEGTQIVMERDSETNSVCYEDSLRNQIEKSSALTSASNSPIKFLSDDDVLNELQLVVAIKQWCKPCGRNDKTKALANSGLMTLRAVRRACEIAKNAGKATPGYVLGVLDNYSKDPDESFFHELNEDGIDEAEIERLFAKKEAAK